MPAVRSDAGSLPSQAENSRITAIPSEILFVTYSSQIINQLMNKHAYNKEKRLYINI